MKIKWWANSIGDSCLQGVYKLVGGKRQKDIKRRKYFKQEMNKVLDCVSPRQRPLLLLSDFLLYGHYSKKGIPILVSHSLISWGSLSIVLLILNSHLHLFCILPDQPHLVTTDYKEFNLILVLLKSFPEDRMLWPNGKETATESPEKGRPGAGIWSTRAENARREGFLWGRCLRCLRPANSERCMWETPGGFLLSDISFH